MLATLPNAVTLAGYASGLVWLAGGSPWFALGSMLADEIDGDMARRGGAPSDYGSLLDWAVDLGLTTAVIVKLGGMYILLAPAILAFQCYLRLQGKSPAFGSARAALIFRALL